LTGLEDRAAHSAFRVLWRPSLRGLTKTLYPHLRQEFPEDPASLHANEPQRRHLYRISSGSMVDSQCVHLGNSVGLQGLRSVRLQFLHLWSTRRSASLDIEPATCRTFFNLSYASSGPAGPFANLDEVLENPCSVF